VLCRPPAATACTEAGAPLRAVDPLPLHSAAPAVTLACIPALLLQVGAGSGSMWGVFMNGRASHGNCELHRCEDRV
jgi:hypothetical protein